MREITSWQYPNFAALDACPSYVALLNSDEWIWRGQSVTEPPTPLIWRSEYLRMRGLWPQIMLHVREFTVRTGSGCEASDRSPKYCTPDPSITELAIARHYGLATPCLDWTFEPSIARFFALQAIGGQEHAFIFAINRRVVGDYYDLRRRRRELIHDSAQHNHGLRLYEHRELDPRTIEQHSLLNRMAAQKALLMRVWPANGGTNVEQHLVHKHWIESARDVPYFGYCKFAISVSENELSAELARLRTAGVDHQSMFPGNLDAIAADLNCRWRTLPFGQPCYPIHT